MGDSPTSIISEVSDYYTEKLDEFGDTPKGVDWNGEESQQLRFKQLLKVVESNTDFSINDLGCGYGALHEYLLVHRLGSKYSGFDVSQKMIDAAKLRAKLGLAADFFVSSEPTCMADYGVASGIFNVRLTHQPSEWWDYMLQVIDKLDETSTRGFSFNCLTKYSDREKMRDYLYYADPCALFDLCKKKYSRNVALLHDYGLYEFTILVKK